MPGLAKVGKTTRNPKERLSELSSATGVPSPFILAFEQPVVDCHASETWVHAELGRRGHRLSDSREFFSAPLYEIIAVVTASSVVEGGPDAQDSAEDACGSDPDSLAGELSALADDYRDGRGDVLRDLKRALELYEQSAKLGDIYSCKQAAELLREGGVGLKPDVGRALSHLKKALTTDAAGGWMIASEIAEIYSEQNQPESSLAYWKIFAERIDDRTPAYQVGRLWRYCFDVVTRRLASVNRPGFRGGPLA